MDHFVAAGDAGADVGPLGRWQRHQCGAAGAPGEPASLPQPAAAWPGACRKFQLARGFPLTMPLGRQLVYSPSLMDATKCC